MLKENGGKQIGTIFTKGEIACVMVSIYLKTDE